jgi:hypothetical protein
MAKLSQEEQNLLKKLQAKAEAPDAPEIGKSLRADINLGDPEQVKLAKKYGFLPPDEDESEEEGSEEPDEKPKRRGYFGEE